MGDFMSNRIKNYLLFFITGIALCLVPGCSKKHQVTTVPQATVAPLQTITTTPQITVWVHGTSGITPLRKLHTAPCGLRSVSSLPHSYHLKKTIALLCKKDPERFDYQHFYTFGWSGQLSQRERSRAAYSLCQALEGLIDEYKKIYGVDPYIRLITHSHGGNVALNITTVPYKSFTVDELILLACPVQNATKNYIKDSFFKKIYSLYSDIDMLQVLDPQGLHENKVRNIAFKKDVFSQRRFIPQDNLRQARIKMRGRAPFHAEFVMGHFIQKLPIILNAMDDQEDPSKPLLIRC